VRRHRVRCQRISRPLPASAPCGIFPVNCYLWGIDIPPVGCRIMCRVPRAQTQHLRCLQGDPQRKRGGKWPRSTAKRVRSEFR